MIRHLITLSPTIVLFTIAFVIWVWGRTDFIVISGCIALAVAIAAQTCSIYRDIRRTR